MRLPVQSTEKFIKQLRKFDLIYQNIHVWWLVNWRIGLSFNNMVIWKYLHSHNMLCTSWGEAWVCARSASSKASMRRSIGVIQMKWLEPSLCSCPFRRRRFCRGTWWWTVDINHGVGWPSFALTFWFLIHSCSALPSCELNLTVWNKNSWSENIPQLEFHIAILYEHVSFPLCCWPSWLVSSCDRGLQLDSELCESWRLMPWSIWDSSSRIKFWYSHSSKQASYAA